ncbi:MAG: hypothetical protein ACLR5B_11465 [Blautia sp.]
MIERKEAIGKSRLYGIQDVAVEIAETISHHAPGRGRDYRSESYAG